MGVPSPYIIVVLLPALTGLVFSLFSPSILAIFQSLSYSFLMNIFVSNLSVSAHKNHLKNLFSEFGIVRSIIVIKGYFTKKTNTTCWVVIDNRADAENAIRNLDHSMFMEKTISVSEAKLYL